MRLTCICNLPEKKRKEKKKNLPEKEGANYYIFM